MVEVNTSLSKEECRTVPKPPVVVVDGRKMIVAGPNPGTIIEQKLCQLADEFAPEDPHCTSMETTLWTLADDPLCRVFPAFARCFSDGTETFTSTDPDGGTYTTLEALMANATPYSAPVLTNIEVKDELRNFHFVVPAGGFTGTVADLIDAALAATPVAIQLPSDAAPVAVTNADTCSWQVDVQPCFAELETGEIVPEGADFAFIGGLKATGDGDAATAGADVSTTVNAPQEGAILTVCATFLRSEQTKG